jgi:O-antigen/teichoic acid export membrane protein
MLKFAWPLYISSLVTFLYTWYDKAIVLASLPLSDLGIYNTAYTAFSLLATIAAALGSSLLPYYGMAYGKKDHNAISSAIRRSTKYTMLIVFPLALGLLAGSKQILVLFAGVQYEGGWIMLAILGAFGLVYGIMPALTNILLIYGKTKTMLLLSIMPVVLSLVMLPLVWVIGLNGLAIMRGTGFLLTLVLTKYLVSRLVRFSFSKSTFAKVIFASATMALALLLFQQFFVSKYAFIGALLAATVIYFAMVRVLKVLDDDDFCLLRSTIGKRLTNFVEKILR